MPKNEAKKTLCEQHNVTIMYYAESNKYGTFMGEEMLKDTEELINKIKNYYGSYKQN